MTADLLVVRHAIAEERDPARWPDDAVRPLTAAGAEKFARAARRLARVVPAPVCVLASPYARARQTADILALQARWPFAQEMSALTPDVTADALVDALQGLDTASGPLAIVGHEPQLSLVIAFLCGARVELKKGGVARMSVAAWGEGGATLRLLATPKMLRSG